MTSSAAPQRDARDGHDFVTIGGRRGELIRSGMYAPCVTLVVSASLALAVVAPVAASAHAGTGGDSVIHACVKGRLIRIAPSRKTAKYVKGLHAIHFAKKGPKGARGAAGPVGPQGLPAPVAASRAPQGPAGADGVSGYEIVTGGASALSSNAGTVTTTCPDGKKVVGGGWVVGGQGDPAIRSSRPTSETAWSMSSTGTSDEGGRTPSSELARGPARLALQRSCSGWWMRRERHTRRRASRALGSSPWIAPLGSTTVGQRLGR